MNSQGKRNITSIHSSCPRCQGFMLPLELWDIQETCYPFKVFGSKCVNCGFVNDPIIWKHHQAETTPPPRPSYPRTYARPLKLSLKNQS